MKILLMIHDVADPQTTSSTSSRPDAHPFQKNSSALTKRDRGVSSHGNSSMKMTFLVALDCRIRSLSNSNASSQLFGILSIFMPESLSEAHHPNNCSLSRALACPEWANVNIFLKVCLTRKVLPTRRRPYTTTNFDSVARYVSISSLCSLIRPMIIIFIFLMLLEVANIV